jgi:hypothetical protein
VIAVAVAGVLAIAVVVALAVSGGGSTPALAPPASVPAAVSRFPAPPAGAFVLARQDDTDVLALAVLPQAPGVALQVSDVTQDGTGATGLRVSFAVSSKGGTVSRNATACGAGCYRATVRLTSPPRRVQVRVARPARTTRWAVTLPEAWPARDATAIVARAGSVWRKLRSLRYHERLASDSRHAVVSDWQIVAPDRLAYQIEGEGQAVIIGKRRWDRQKGGDWVQTSALRLHQPVPLWVQVTDAHVLGSATVQGRAVWRVSFFDPRTPGWFVAAIDKRSYRTLDVRMTAAAHFMHDTYGSFNTSIKIDAPSAS